MSARARQAVVTGAASGIGRDVCRDLVERGWKVFGLDRDEQGLGATAKSLGAADRFHAIACDVANAASVANAFERIAAHSPSIDALVASAGIIRTGALLEMDEADFDALFAVNVKGAWLTARAALPLLERAAAGDAGAPRVVLLSSIAALRPKVGGGAYGASKAALTQMTKVLAAELARKGILVNAVAPGTVDTPFIQSFTKPGSSYRVSGASPLGRIAQPADVTAVIRFLLSEDARYVAGAILPVDGATTTAFDPR